MENEATRRRSPGWVRAYASPALHGLALKLMRLGEREDLSDAQEWLWSAVVSELEYRRRTERNPWLKCSCMLCIPPFED